MFLVPTNNNSSRRSSLFHAMCTPFYSALKIYIRMDRKHYYEKVRHGSSLDQKEKNELFAFRVKCYEQKASYLVPKTVEEISKEKIYDENAYHAIVKDGRGQIVAASRFLPYPFEMCSIELPDDLRLSQFSNYLEISRLVTNRPGKGIGKRLLIHAGIWAIEDTFYDGFLAICREQNLKLFSYFGLSKLANFHLEARRGSEYSLIKADFRLISKATFKFFALNKNPVTQLALSLKTLSRSSFSTRS